MFIPRIIEYFPIPSPRVLSLGVHCVLFFFLYENYFLHAQLEDNLREQRIKAAYLYNFLLLSEWPEKKHSANEERIVLGILGGLSFDPEIFDPIRGEVLNDKKLVIKFFHQSSSNQELKECHLLFINSSTIRNLPTLLKNLNASSVLTISDIQDFIHAGGMIQFVKEKNKIRFEINKQAVEQNRIVVPAQVYKLAVRIVK